MCRALFYNKSPHAWSYWRPESWWIKWATCHHCHHQKGWRDESQVFSRLSNSVQLTWPIRHAANKATTQIRAVWSPEPMLQTAILCSTFAKAVSLNPSLLKHSAETPLLSKPSDLANKTTQQKSRKAIQPPMRVSQNPCRAFYSWEELAF